MKKLRRENVSMQKQLLAHFINDNPLVFPDSDLKDYPQKALVEKEKYLMCVQEVDRLDNELKNIHSYYESTISEMKVRLEDKVHKANEIRDAFIAFKREVAKDSENSKTGKPIPLKVIMLIRIRSYSGKLILQFEKEENSIDHEVEEVRLKNINLRKQYSHLEKTARQRVFSLLVCHSFKKIRRN